jgi:hypothetical protein
VKESEVETENSKIETEKIHQDKLPSDVSNPIITLNNQEKDLSMSDVDLMNHKPISGEGLKRSKRCLNSMDRSASRSPTPRMRRSRSRSRSRVPSEIDYKEWFGKFDNNESPELEVDDFDYEIDEECEDEEILLENLSDAQIESVIKKKQTSSTNHDVTHLNSNGSLPKNNENDNDVSVSVTFNLSKNKQNDLAERELEFFNAMTSEYKFSRRSPNAMIKTEEFLENERKEEVKHYRKGSIIPSTEEEQARFQSFLHPEDFKPDDTSTREPHIHHQHLHNVGYSEWIKKLIEHNSSHLTLSDSDSDSDPELNETDMLPTFTKESKKKLKRRLKRSIAIDQSESSPLC